LSESEKRELAASNQGEKRKIWDQQGKGRKLDGFVWQGKRRKEVIR
jgi:hypothetical protein